MLIVPDGQCFVKLDASRGINNNCALQMEGTCELMCDGILAPEKLFDEGGCGSNVIDFFDKIDLYALDHNQIRLRQHPEAAQYVYQAYWERVVDVSRQCQLSRDRQSSVPPGQALCFVDLTPVFAFGDRQPTWHNPGTGIARGSKHCHDGNFYLMLPKCSHQVFTGQLEIVGPHRCFQFYSLSQNALGVIGHFVLQSLDW